MTTDTPLDGARRAFERRLRADVERLRNGGDPTAAASVEQNSGAIVDDAALEVAQRVVHLAAEMASKAGGKFAESTASDDVGPSDIHSALMEYAAELWPFDDDAAVAELERAFAELAPWTADADRGDQVPWLYRLFREVYWRSTLPVFSVWRAWQLLDVVASGGAFDLLRDVARLIVGKDASDECLDELAKATMQSVRRIRDGLGLGDSPPQTNELALQALSALNEAFCKHLERIGKKGRESAQLAREKTAADPGLLWNVDPEQQRPARCLKILARVLWIEQVEPLVNRSALRRPAVVRAVAHDRLIPMMTRQTMFSELDDGTIRDVHGREIGRVSLTTDATLEVVRRGAHALGTVTGNRLLRALIHRSHDAWNRGDHQPDRVMFAGGWTGLLDDLGCTRSHFTLIKEIAIAGQQIVWATPHADIGGLWLWSAERGSKTAPGRVSFKLGETLSPGYADLLSRQGGNSSSARTARRLVPELRYEPPMGGARENDHGAIWTLHRLALVEFVDRAEELHADGAVVITGARWRELAKQAGVSTSIVDRTLDAWVAGESERARPLLERVDRDAWTLAEPHAPERQFIVDGGEKRARGRTRKTRAQGRRGTPG